MFANAGQALKRYDSVIIGAGHNGLVCAAYLARAGQRVLVLEANDSAGGMAASHEFHPGFSAGLAHTAGHFPASISNDLELAARGTAAADSASQIVGLDREGQHVSITQDSIAGVDAADESAWREYSGMMQRFAAALEPFWGKCMPRIGQSGRSGVMTFAHLGLNLRRLGKADLHEFLRIASLPARDLLDERFGSSLLKASLCWDGLIGSRMAPRSPNGAVLMMLYRSGREAWRPAALIGALETAAKAAGAEIRTSTRVARVLLDDGAKGPAAIGIELEDGEQVAASNIISSADPKTTFLNLVGVQNLDIGFTNRIRRYRTDGLVGKLHLALEDMPDFSGLDRPSGRLLIAPGPDAIEFAFDDAKYGNCSTNPVLEVTIPTLDDASLAPGGAHLLSAHVLFVPYRLKGGWNDVARESMADRAVATLEQYVPGLRRRIVGHEFLSPQDIEARYGSAGGHWHHGDFAMDQMLMMRPTYEAAQYRTPVSGLWLCGAGCHPAGDLTGFAGRNAAREILR